MGKVIKLGVLLALLFAAMWFGGAFALKRGLAGWFEGRRDVGWVAEFSQVKSVGFPGRLETQILDLELADPSTGLAWSAPDFAFYAPSWNPGRITAVWPREQVIATPLGKITLISREMQAAVTFNETTDLNLDQITFDLLELALSSSLGWESSLETGQLTLQQIEGPDFTYQVHFEAKGLVPASAFIKRFSHIALVGERIEGVTLDAVVRFNAPWDRFAVENARPQITHIKLDLLTADWGELALWLAGELEVDSAGVPEGQITVKARNWREMVALAKEMGAVPEALESPMVSALSFLASLSGDKSTLDTPLTFRNGYIAFGPLPIGPAPNLTIR